MKKGILVDRKLKISFLSTDMPLLVDRRYCVADVDNQYCVVDVDSSHCVAELMSWTIDLPFQV